MRRGSTWTTASREAPPPAPPWGGAYSSAICFPIASLYAPPQGGGGGRGQNIAASFTAHGDTVLKNINHENTPEKISLRTLAEPPNAGADTKRGGNGRDNGGYQPNPKVPFLVWNTHGFFLFFRKTGEKPIKQIKTFIIALVMCFSRFYLFSPVLLSQHF